MTPQLETPAVVELDTEALDLVVAGATLSCRKTGGRGNDMQAAPSDQDIIGVL